MRLLEELAYHFFPDEELTEEAVDDFLWGGATAYMAKLPAAHPLLTQLGTTPQEALCQDGVLVPCGGADSYMFLHLTFQEYLTACALARRLDKASTTADNRRRGDGHPRRLPRVWQEVNRNAWLPERHEVLLLLAGALKEPLPLFKLLVDELCPDKPQDDVFRHRLALAASCLSELSTANRQVYAAHVDQITTAAFGMWWKHCERNTNALVSHLTQALPALGQVNGRVPYELPHYTGKGQRSLPTPAGRDGIFLQEWLVQQLGAEDARVRWAAVRAVERLGSAAATEPFLAALARLLAHNDADVRWAAVQAVKGLGSAAATEPILATVVRLLEHNDDRIRQAAAQTVRGLMKQGIRMFHTPQGIWVTRHIKALASS